MYRACKRFGQETCRIDRFHEPTELFAQTIVLRHPYDSYPNRVLYQTRRPGKIVTGNLLVLGVLRSKPKTSLGWRCPTTHRGIHIAVSAGKGCVYRCVTRLRECISDEESLLYLTFLRDRRRPGVGPGGCRTWERSFRD